MTTKLSAAELTHVVTAIPGVRGLEPGIGSTLKTIGSRMSGNPAAARFGVIIESGGQKITLEIGIDGTRPVKEIVRDVQDAVLRSIAQANPDRKDYEADATTTPQVRVRVQSLL